MIVAIEPSTEAHQDSIIGFMEVGQLPAPVEPRREAPYFGNVAVSANVRRQGIGERLVKIALKLVQDKWKDDIVYVAVDASNTAAVDMYRKCGFQVYKP
jgi:ribosomal protein S18 acetylase RimI-like enzyme